MNCRLLTGTLYLCIRIVGYTFRPAGAKRVEMYVIYTHFAPLGLRVNLIHLYFLRFGCLKETRRKIQI